MGQATSDSMVGKTIAGKFKILAKLGRGGMGAVYKAEHTHLDRVIALKLLHSHLAKDEEYLKRFQREARTACKIRHPNVITLHDYGIEEGHPYLAMEFIEGQTLKQILKDEGTLSLDRVFNIVSQICSALAEAHGNNIIHRDLKPDNIMITERRDGTAWAQVLDFGISKVLQAEPSTELTQAGTIFGSPRYMAPEQGLEKSIDTRADLYSLGVMTYEMLTKKYPIEANTMMETLVKVVHEDPIPIKEANPDVFIDDRISQPIMRLLERDADKRYQKVEDFFEDFEKAYYAVTGKTKPSTFFTRPIGIALAATSFLLAGSALYLTSREDRSPRVVEEQAYLKELEQLRREKEEELAKVAKLAEERKKEAFAAALDAEKRRQLEQIELEQLIEIRKEVEAAAALAEEKRQEALEAATRAESEKTAAEQAAVLAAQEADAFRAVRQAEEKKAEEYSAQAERANTLAEQKRLEAMAALKQAESRRKQLEQEAMLAKSEVDNLRGLREEEERKAEQLRKEAELAEKLAAEKQLEAKKAAERAAQNEQRAASAEQRAEELKKQTAKMAPANTSSDTKSQKLIEEQRKLDAQKAALEAERQKLEQLKLKREQEAKRLKALRAAQEEAARKAQAAEEAKQAEEEAEHDDRDKRRRMPRQGKRRF
ncbi:MAG: protein kinase [Bdellovibrionales bacterium]|nr:protein kinase [Bdellovibrionales bacterium]